MLLGIIACITAALLVSTAVADENSETRSHYWHQWRGPEATGVAPQGNPPLRWDDRTNIKWKAPLPGRGASTPIVWDDRIFLLTAIKTDRRAGQSAAGDSREKRGDGESTLAYYHQFVVLCLDRQTGDVLWREVACEVVPHQRHHDLNSFATASPVTDGRYVYCSFGSRGVYCYDMEGNQRWRADLGQFDIKFGFGEGSSPTLHGDTLIVNCDHEGDSFITALDAATGERKWTVPRDENSTWNTPLVTEHNGRTQVIVSGAVKARSYDLDTGDLIWEYGERKGVDAIPSPLRFDDLAICTSGLRGDPAYAIPLSSSGDLTARDQVAWKHTRGTPQTSTPALVGDRLYFVKGRTGILSCLNARTGEAIIDQERVPGLEEVFESPVAAAGRVYFTSRNGTTVVLDATANEVRVLAQNRLNETILGSPAIAGREIFLRGEQHLYCIADEEEL